MKEVLKISYVAGYNDGLQKERKQKYRARGSNTYIKGMRCMTQFSIKPCIIFLIKKY